MNHNRQYLSVPMHITEADRAPAISRDKLIQRYLEDISFEFDAAVIEAESQGLSPESVQIASTLIRSVTFHFECDSISA